MNDHLSPHNDHETRAIVDQAIDSLGNLRGLMCLDDPGVQLHLIASLSLQMHASLTTAVLKSRTHGYAWTEIAALLGVSPEVARRRFREAEPVDTR
jgi:hypothetical protein